MDMADRSHPSAAPPSKTNLVLGNLPPKQVGFGPTSNAVRHALFFVMISFPRLGYWLLRWERGGRRGKLGRGGKLSEGTLEDARDGGDSDSRDARQRSARWAGWDGDGFESRWISWLVCLPVGWWAVMLAHADRLLSSRGPIAPRQGRGARTGSRLADEFREVRIQAFLHPQLSWGVGCLINVALRIVSALRRGGDACGEQFRWRRPGTGHARGIFGTFSL